MRQEEPRIGKAFQDMGGSGLPCVQGDMDFAVSSVKYGLDAGAWRRVPILGSLCFILVFKPHAIKNGELSFKSQPWQSGAGEQEGMISILCSLEVL